MLIPMPSPRGTNHAKLFLRARGPVAAYDSRRGLAADAALSDEKKGAILDFLAGKLSSDDIMSVKAMLSGERAYDEPPDFPGKPKVGGGMTALDRLPSSLRREVIDRTLSARDSRAKSFAERFPDAARIGQAW